MYKDCTDCVNQILTAAGQTALVSRGEGNFLEGKQRKTKFPIFQIEDYGRGSCLAMENCRVQKKSQRKGYKWWSMLKPQELREFDS